MKKIFTPVLEKEGKYISSNDWLPGSFPIGMGILYPVVRPQCIHHQKIFHAMNTLLNRIHVSPLLVASVIFLFDIMITTNTNRKVSQATSHCLKYIFVPSLELE